MTLEELRSKSTQMADKTALSKSEQDELSKLVPEWLIDEDGRLVTNLEFEDFVSAVAVVNDIAVLAEEEGHHPDLLIYDYKNLGIALLTHDAGGLTEKDFVLAAKIDELIEDISE